LFTLLDVSLWGQFIYIGIYGVLGDWVFIAKIATTTKKNI
jgi:hypothetical protein